MIHWVRGLPIFNPHFYMGIVMLTTIYTHGFSRHEVNEILLDMASLKDAIQTGRGGQIERAKLHYAIERFCSYSIDGDAVNYELKNIGDLYSVYKEGAEYMKPTFEYWQKQRGVEDDT